jgi:hypothetical protein
VTVSLKSKVQSLKSRDKLLRSKRRRYLATAPGVRPSPGAATFALLAAVEQSCRLRCSGIAAPGDGRTPGAVAKCTPKRQGLPGGCA